MQEAAGESTELAYVDRGYTGEEASAEAHGIRLEVVKHSGSKKGFFLLTRRWVVERSFARVGDALPAAGEGLRTAAGDRRGAALRGLRLPRVLNRAVLALGLGP